MANELAGKAAIVTGAASGIGRASAELFAEEGARVVVADLDVEHGEEVARGIGAAAVFIKADVSSAADSQAMIDLALSKFGKLDVMFNNAGISCKPVANFLDDEFVDFDAVMRVNVLGVMLGIRNAGRAMRAAGNGGSIINTSSISGGIAGLGMINYRAAKAAAVQVSKSAAIDLGQYNIRVNCILPGHVRTTMTKFNDGVDAETARRITEGVDRAYLRNQPIKRRGEPIEVAEAALFLASDRSRYVTGIVMPVDAGVSTGDPVNHLQEILDAQRIGPAGA